MRENPAAFFLVPDGFKTQELCEIAIWFDPWSLYDIPDYLKTQKMCDNVVRGDPYSLQFVQDCFVTKKQIDVWYYDDEYRNDDELIEWYNGYQKRKVQKTKTKRRVNAHCLASRSCDRLVYARRQKEAVEVIDTCI